MESIIVRGGRVWMGVLIEGWGYGAGVFFSFFWGGIRGKGSVE